MRLFDRGRAGVEPTVFGRSVLERGASLLADEAALRIDLQQLAGLEAGELVDRRRPFSAAISVGRAMTRFLAKHPQIRARIARLDPEQVVRDVLAGRCDARRSRHRRLDPRLPPEARAAPHPSGPVRSRARSIRWPAAPACASPTCSRSRSCARAFAALPPRSCPERGLPGASIPTPAISCRPSPWTRSISRVAHRGVEHRDPAGGARNGLGRPSRPPVGSARLPRAVDGHELRPVPALRPDAFSRRARVRRGAPRRRGRDRRRLGEPGHDEDAWRATAGTGAHASADLRSELRTQGASVARGKETVRGR